MRKNVKSLNRKNNKNRIIVILSDLNSLEYNPDVKIFIETAQRQGYEIMKKKGKEEFMAIGDFGVSYDPREASTLILRLHPK